MTGSVKVALLQLNSARDYAPNLAAISELTRAAAATGAKFVLTPENAALLEPDRGLLRAKALREDEHPAISHFSALAADLKIWFLAGSIAILGDDNFLYNRSYLIAPTGTIASRYDKIHQFDVDLPNGEHYRESASFAAGDRAVVAATPVATIGMTVCYDLRFAYLYRALAQAGAAIITVPSAFTVPTGQAHWHILLRARAIETGAFILAPAQTGTHAENRRTYGHSLIVDPWGEVLADGGSEVGFVSAELDLGKVAIARAQIPAWQHDRLIVLPNPTSSSEPASLRALAS